MKTMKELGWFEPIESHAVDLAKAVLAAWQSSPKSHEKHWANVANLAAFIVKNAARQTP